MMGLRSNLSRFSRGAFFAAVALLAFGASEAKAACSAVVEENLVQALARQAPGLRPEVLRMAIKASSCAAEEGLVKRKDLLTVIDYSMPSNKPRLFTFNMTSKKLVFRELVAHGKNSGGMMTNFFSNRPNSLATSLGLYVTDSPYVGSNGYSLRLRGLDKGFNDRAWERAIVMHGASYVNDAITRTMGRLGRSWGCPAVRKEIARKMIDTVKGGSAIFAYYPDQEWLKSSRFLG